VVFDCVRKFVYDCVPKFVYICVPKFVVFDCVRKFVYDCIPKFMYNCVQLCTKIHVQLCNQSTLMVALFNKIEVPVQMDCRIIRVIELNE